MSTALKLDPPHAPMLRVTLPQTRTQAEREVLTPQALAFVVELVREFRLAIEVVLDARKARAREVRRGSPLGFRSETAEIRHNRDWCVAAAPHDLVRRHVEITGPVDRKMIINALNSGADVFMADFEDATSPTWTNVIEGQRNVRDAVRRTISHTDLPSGKQYALAERPATLLVRPRGLHLVEQHMLVDGLAVPASLFDFGLFFFHNAAELLSRGSGPYLYLPKLESHREARLWNEVFLFAQRGLGIPRGSVRATVLIETLPAAFEMEEILYELREHASGLNCGRWDYIFSAIRTRQHDPTAIFPDRAQVTMTQPSLRAYSRLLIEICHRRGAHAIGGMSAFIPVKEDPAANQQAFEQVRSDKRREVSDGHDGTWVAHPALVPIARTAFAEYLGEAPHQIDRARPPANVGASDLLRIPEGTRTEAGLRHNIRVALQYLEAWLRGQGAVPLYNLMEDAATAEISRAQVWQWIHHGVLLSDGSRVTAERVDAIAAEELDLIRQALGDPGFHDRRFGTALEVFTAGISSIEMPPFVTSLAYRALDDTKLVDPQPTRLLS
jgi:malate synthase A